MPAVDVATMMHQNLRVAPEWRIALRDSEQAGHTKVVHLCGMQVTAFDFLISRTEDLLERYDGRC